MKIRRTGLALVLILIASLASLTGNGQAVVPAGGGSAAKPVLSPGAAVGANGLHFTANEGQHDARVLFQARTPGFVLWLTKEALVFDRTEKDGRGEPSRSLSRMIFKGANIDVEVTASDASDYKVSYFFGRDESEWKTGISASRAVVYRNLYDGIDLKVYGTEKQIEYDWVVGPGADPGKIGFTFSGAETPTLDADGNLVIETTAGRIVQRKPVAHQTIDGRRTDVEAAFHRREDGSFGFEVGAYDPRVELTIDPLVLAYSTYLGGHDLEMEINIAADPTGALYISGFTFSGDFPPEFGAKPRIDFFVTKLSSDGANLIYTAFFPVARYPKETPLDIFVDAKGFVYLAGITGSTGFPVKNAFQTQLKGFYDGFVLKLSRDGQSLLFSSYIGGSGMDWCSSLAVDGSGAAYIGGLTYSRDFPRKRAYQPALRGRSDGFVAKVSLQESGLVYSTYLGGSHDDRVNALAVDSEGALVLGGETASPDFPRKLAFQNSLGGNMDGFVAKLNAAGSGLVFSSFFGGASFETVHSLALDGSGAAYLTGYTQGKIPVKNAFQASRKGISDAFVLKVEPNGRSVVYASYLGGVGLDIGWGIAADDSGAAYVVGVTQSADFPIKSPYQPSRRGSQDAFLTVVDPAGGKLTLSTFLGGSYRETGWDIYLDASGEILIGGVTNSLDLPKAGTPYQDALDGDYDAFVLKFTRGDAGLRR